MSSITQNTNPQSRAHPARTEYEIVCNSSANYNKVVFDNERDVDVVVFCHRNALLNPKPSTVGACLFQLSKYEKFSFSMSCKFYKEFIYALKEYLLHPPADVEY